MMKTKLFTCILTSFLILFLSKSQGQELLPNAKGDTSLIGVINQAIASGNIPSHPLFILNGEKVSEEDFILLNHFSLDEFTSINYLVDESARALYGEEGKEGVVVITSFLDERLGLDYYKGIENEFISAAITSFVVSEGIRQNPLLILNGTPLLGPQIAERINTLKVDAIKEVSLLK
ncbi:MAG: hypothetical protein AAF696_06815 [Bacteroidota bacterium]